MKTCSYCGKQVKKLVLDPLLRENDDIAYNCCQECSVKVIDDINSLEDPYVERDFWRE